MEWIDPGLLVIHLRALDAGRFVALCNSLLARAAARGQIDATHLELTLNITDPDGGVDARCHDAPRQVGRLIPAPNVVYQFKGGTRKRTAPQIAREDIAEKPRVLEALAAAATLVYVAAADYGPEVAARVRDAAAKRGVEIRPDQLIVINAETLAHELQGFPSLIAGFLGLDERLFAFDEWSRFPPLSNPFQRDDDLETRIRDLVAQIAPARSVTHVVGAAGNGKTRIVLETLRAPELAGDVLYARQPDDVSAAVWAHLRNTPDAQCILVVDEVDDVEGAELKDYFALTGPGVRLVMIGRDASGRAKAGTVRVEGLNEELLVRAIEAVAPGLPKEAAQEIAAVCEQSPKLAVLLAQRAHEDPRLVEHYHRLADPQIRGVLETFLPLEEDDVLALSTVALLEHVGWKDEASSESATLFEFVGLDPIASRDRVNHLDERFGIAPLAGRYRYVSPEILADHLAARQLNAWPAGKFREVFDQLPPHMTASLAARVRRLAGVLANARTVEEVILGDQGPFRSLADTEKGRLATLLPELVGPFPRASLRALRRLIDPASGDELRAASSSRRPLVNALTDLLWSEDTFEEAATLLLRLATNENEGFSNNATGVFVETFQTQLGRTAAGPDVRARVLRRAAASDNPREREVAALAIEAALKTGHIVRMGNPPRGVPGMPEREWRPKTYGEWYDAIGAYLGILAPLLRDADAAVRIAAVEALVEATVVACDVSRITDVWIAAARNVIGADFDLRSKLLDAMEGEFERVRRREEPKEMEMMPEEERTRIRKAQTERIAKLRAFHDELAGGDFSSRFRRTLTRTPWATMRLPIEDEARRIREALEQIVAEVVQDATLLDPEWDWLLEEHGSQPEQFSELLGRADRARRFAEKLAALARDNARAMGWLSLYEIGYGLASGDRDHVDRVAGALVGAPARAPQLFDLLMRGGHSPGRVRIIADLFRSKAVSGRLIASLGFSPWRTSLAPEEALEVASAAADDPGATAAVVTFLGHYLHEATDATRKLFRALVLRVLVTPRAEEPRRTFDWEWDELAKLYAEAAPIEVAAALLQDIAAREYAHDRMLDGILRQAWAAAPDKRRFFTEVLAPWLDAQTSGGWWVRQALEHFPVEEVGVDFLVDWVAAKPDPRAHALADVLGQPLGRRPSDLHAALLERFADYGVGDAFFGGLISGTWTGSASSWSQGKLAAAKKWLDDERPAVRRWAARAVANLEQMVEHDLVRDAEERIRR